MRPNPVKRALRAGQPAIGTWLSLGSITAARFLARTGFAWLNVDMEHSLVDWETATHIFASVADAGCTALVRVPANHHDHIKRALDNGAHGIVVPMVNTREEAVAAVRAAKYPPQGNRSVGGSVHALNFDATPDEYYQRANDEVLVVLQCEHIEAVDNADAIFSVPGIDAIFVGPNDLAASMRSPDGVAPGAEVVNRIYQRIRDACRRHGVAPGIHCFSIEQARQRIADGWQFIAVQSELSLMLDAASEVVDQLRLRPSSNEMAKY